MMVTYNINLLSSYINNLNFSGFDIKVRLIKIIKWKIHHPKAIAPITSSSIKSYLRNCIKQIIRISVWLSLSKRISSFDNFGIRKLLIHFSQGCLEILEKIIGKII